MMQLLHSQYKTLVLLVCATLLSSCETTTVRETPSGSPVIQTDNRGIDRLLLDAGRAAPGRATELRLNAAELALEGQDFDLAKRIIASVESPYINDDTTRAYAFIKAEIALQDNDPAAAIRHLEDRRLQGLPLDTATQLRSGTLRARAYRLGRSYIASARELIYIDRLLPAEERQRNHDQIFSTLLRLDADTLQRQAEQSITTEIRGWLSLAAMAKRFQHDPLRQLNALNDWQKVWPTHPAATIVPRSLQSLSRIVAERPKHVALILPLSGPLGSLGSAIRDGYIAAHYELTPDTRLDIYDSNQAEVIELVNRASDLGAKIIIGPLDRAKVTQLARTPLPVPVIALNRTEAGEINPNLYQFGLAPEDESEQVAEQVFQEGKVNGLILAPDNDWGRRNYNAFVDRFAETGGIVVDAAFYEESRDYSEVVKSLLNVDSSETRASNLRRIIGERFEFTARRRQDIEFIFLLGNANQARGINPTLAFFYAEDVPVYSTSHINVGDESRIDSIDLNGIRFCDIPWKLSKSDDLQTLIEQTWPAMADQLGSFFALGTDAHRLYPRVQQLKETPEERIFGSTGVLKLDEFNVIRRSLMWAQYREGQVQPVPMIFGSVM